MKLKELSEKINYPFFGDGNLEVEGVRDLAFSTPISASHIYLVASKKVMAKNSNSKDIKLAITTEKFQSDFTNGILIPESETKLALAKTLALYERIPDFGTGISERASIHPTAKLGKNVTVLDFAVIMKDAIIGDNTVIHPHSIIEPGAIIGDNTIIRANVAIGYNCKIGKNCIIHSNTTIGADGFGFLDHKGTRVKVPQIGIVQIGDDVEIGANCTVDRAAIEYTSIGNFTKIDDQVHIGHNCRIGNYVYMAGASVLAGGVSIEDYSIIGGLVAVAEQLTVKKGSIIMGLTGITKDTEEKGMYFGIPARPATEMLRISAVLGELPNLIKRVKKLEDN